MSHVEGAPAVGSVAHLLPQTYKRLISEWLEEDTPSFDYGGFVVGEEPAEAKLLGKSKVRGFVTFLLSVRMAAMSASSRSTLIASFKTLENLYEQNVFSNLQKRFLLFATWR